MVANVGKEHLCPQHATTRDFPLLLQFPLSATAPMVWLPYTAIDQLLQALQESSTNHHNSVVGAADPEKKEKNWELGPGQGRSADSDAFPLAQLYQKLHAKLEDYQEKVSVATRDRLYRRN